VLQVAESGREALRRFGEDLDDLTLERHGLVPEVRASRR